LAESLAVSELGIGRIAILEALASRELIVYLDQALAQRPCLTLMNRDNANNFNPTISVGQA
jgi:hypothetical protein